MDSPGHQVGVDSFLGSVRARIANGETTIALDGGELPVWTHLCASPSVVFTFTGAANREKPLPQFASTGLWKRVPASIIALADPSLDRNDELRLAWYAGHRGFELQKLLPGLLRQIIDSLGATRVAFVGGSGGGFAALYYSAKIPGSVAVVLNPQTNLNKYHWGHRKRYRTVCWPSLDEKAPLDSVIDANLLPLYAEPLTNTVICIQIASDYFHLTRQCTPFVAGLPSEYRDHLILRVANWGVQGHKPAPRDVWIPWLAAALSAPDTTASAIEEAWAACNPVLYPAAARIAAAANGRVQGAARATPGDFESLIGHSSPNPAARDRQIAAALSSSAASALFRSEPDRKGPL